MPSTLSLTFGKFQSPVPNLEIREFGGCGHSVRRTVALWDAKKESFVDGVDVQGLTDEKAVKKVRALLKENQFKPC